MDTLALGYTLPAIGRVTDLHRLENVRAGRTQKKRVAFLQLSDFQCGVTGNRTRDTRIFSPLLYQLSYDTISVLGLQR